MAERSGNEKFVEWVEQNYTVVVGDQFNDIRKYEIPEGYFHYYLGYWDGQYHWAFVPLKDFPKFVKKLAETGLGTFLAKLKQYAPEATLLFLTTKRGQKLLRLIIFPLTIGLILTWARSWPYVARLIIESIRDTFLAGQKTWIPFVAGYIEALTGHHFTEEEIKEIALVKGSKQFMELLGEKFLAPILQLSLPEPPLTEQKGWDKAETFLGLNLSFQLSAWILHLIGDIFSLGRLKSLKDLPNAINWSFGLGWLSWLVMGPIFRITIADPMEWDLNAIYTPQMPRPSEAAKLRLAELISPQEYTKFMLKQGYHPDLASNLLQLAEKEIPDSILQDLIELGTIDDDDIDQELRFKGYGPHRRNLIKWFLKHKRLFKLQEKLANEAIDAFEKAIIPESKTRAILEASGYNQEEIDLIITTTKLKMATNKAPTDALVKRAYQKGKISYTHAHKILTDRGWDPDWAEIYLTT